MKCFLASIIFMVSIANAQIAVKQHGQGQVKTEPTVSSCSITSTQPSVPVEDFSSILSTAKIHPNDVVDFITIALRGLNVENLQIIPYQDGTYEVSGFYTYNSVRFYTAINLETWTVQDDGQKIYCSFKIFDLQGCPIDSLQLSINLPLQLTISPFDNSSIHFLIDPLQQNGTQPFSPFRIVRNLSNEAMDLVQAGDGNHKCVCCNSGGPTDGSCTIQQCDDGGSCANHGGTCKWVNSAGNGTLSLLITMISIMIYGIFYYDKEINNK